jgi:hypothetical protein
MKPNTLLVFDSSRAPTRDGVPGSITLWLQEDDARDPCSSCAVPQGTVVGVLDLGADDEAAYLHGHHWRVRSRYRLTLPTTRASSAYDNEQQVLAASGPGMVLLSRWRYLEWQLAGDVWQLRVMTPATLERPMDELVGACGATVPCVAERQVQLRAGHHVQTGPAAALVFPKPRWWSATLAADQPLFEELRRQLDGVHLAVSLDGAVDFLIFQLPPLLRARVPGALTLSDTDAPLPPGHKYLEWRLSSCAEDSIWDLVKRLREPV